MAALDAVNTLCAVGAVDSSAGLPLKHVEAGDKATGTILIIDPAAARRWNILQALTDVAGTILEASSTSEGLAILHRQQVDLILMDLRAPEIGATNFCREVRNLPGMKFLQLFVLSESDSVDAEVGAIEAGADEFLMAPMRDRALRARVQSKLRHKGVADSLDESETVLFSLAKSVEDRDPDLSIHCQRLSIMAAAMGVSMKLPAHDIVTLQRGGYLHDIGKISIPDRILFKPGPLTPDEWETMKSHTVRGEKICSGIKSLAPVIPIIRSHHERWDGLGYPDGMRGEQIPLLARILQLADIYDALTTVRPYKAAFTPEDALSIIMEETGKGWRDPHLVRIFADLVPMFRGQALPDLSRLSLNALAHSVEAFRKAPSSERPSKKTESGPLRLAG